MARQKKETEGQFSMNDYQFKQVDVRLKLSDGPSYYSKTPMSTPEDAVRVMRDVLSQLDREMVTVVNMDNHLKPINFSIVSIGSVNSSLAPIQNCLKTAMLSNANNIMLFHNHPSGDVEPSEDDESVTKRLSEAAKLMDMSLVDHIIIGGETQNMYSFRDNEPWLFSDRGVDFDFIDNLIAEGKRSVSEKGAEYLDSGGEEALAREIDDLNYDLDPYGYLNFYDNRENGYQDMLDAVRSGHVVKMADEMRENLSDYPEELQPKVKDILRKVEKLKSNDAVSDRRSSYHTSRGKTFDPKQALEARKAELNAITEKLENGVKEIFESGKYKNFLDTMAKFPQYSVNNSMLIMIQKPDASLCQSFTGWKQMGRYVKKGEKGIRILAPSPYKKKIEQPKVGSDGKQIFDKSGKAVTEETEVQMMAFKPVSTFDVSQTEGDPIPSLGVEELSGSVEGYQNLFEALKRSCPVPVAFEDIKSGAKGYFDLENNRIAIKSGMSEVQNVKTLIHEMTHQKLHSIDQKTGKGPEKSRNQKEVEAESTAYTVCQHYGIDTSDYSFGYVAGWSQGKEIPELKESLDTIRNAASEIINSTDEKMEEVIKDNMKDAVYEFDGGYVDLAKAETGEWKYQIIDKSNLVQSTGTAKDVKTAEQAALKILKDKNGYDGKVHISVEPDKIRAAVAENLRSIEQVCGKLHM